MRSNGASIVMKAYREMARRNFCFSPEKCLGSPVPGPLDPQKCGESSGEEVVKSYPISAVKDIDEGKGCFAMELGPAWPVGQGIQQSE